MSRPKSVPVWATDSDYPGGGESWNGTPTKVAPSQERMSRGWEPGSPIPAQHENYYRNAQAEMLAYLSTCEIQNWSDPRVASSSNSTTSPGNFGAVWDPIGRKIVIVGTQTAHYSHNGFDWDSIGFGDSHGQEYRGVAVNPANGFLAVALENSGATTDRLAWRKQDGTNGAVAIANVNDTQGIAWNEAASVFLIFGGASSPARSWLATYDETSVNEVTIGSLSGFSGAIRYLAVSPDEVRAFGVNIAGAYHWFSGPSDMSTITHHGEVPFASNPVGIVWSPSWGLFFATVSTGETYASSGSGWTLKSSNDWEFVTGLATHGSILAAVVKAGGVESIAWSTDAGVSWELIPSPLDPPGTRPKNLSPVDDRLILLSYRSGTDETRAALSLRLK